MRKSGYAIALSAMVAASGAATSGVAAQAPSFDAGYYQFLMTQFRGPDMRLDVFNGGERDGYAHLAPAGHVTGQLWRLTPAGNGSWRLTTMFRGESQCLDVVNGGATNNMVHLSACGNYGGQYWTISQQGASYRLTTAFRGPDMCLDIVNGGPSTDQAHLARCGRYTGQMWYLQPSPHRVVP